jgi:hypothetical protein
VIGSASDIVGVCIEPVIAQLMMILFAMVAFSPVSSWFPDNASAAVRANFGRRPAVRLVSIGPRSSGKIGQPKRLD